MRTTIISKNGLRKVQLNRRKAIHERCLNCVGWESHAVAKCPIADCNLYPFRSGNGQQFPKERSDAIKAHCKDCSNGKVHYCTDETCPLFLYRKG
jgi:hypothetical protein